jgi:glycosyltransferase involved in cell wall biosynthesis
MPKKIAFIKTGSFSLVNENVLNILTRHFPGVEIEIIDVEKDLVNSRAWLNLIFTLKEYGWDILLRRKNYRHCLLRTTHIFKKIKVEVARRLSPANYLFSFQTQSLFDASVPGLPHFVYTDHTHLANLRYPGFDRKNLFARAWVELEKRIYHQATLNFVTSNFAAGSMVEDYAVQPDKVVCVYSGINVPANLLLDRKDYGRKNILFVGVRWERKGGPELLEAFKLVLKAHPDASLTIVGCSPQVDVPNCEVIGLIPAHEVSRYYEKATVFCLPSNLEPSAVALIEASAYRLPVVSTDIGGTPDRVLEGKTGHLFKPGDVAHLAQILIDLIGQPETCQRLGEAGYRLVMERFTWEKVGFRLQENIAAVIGQQAVLAL